tara:strand:- start:232 stop:525 length:294 start_codon:yes stop_codon:yes gene_type:complete
MSRFSKIRSARPLTRTVEDKIAWLFTPLIPNELVPETSTLLPRVERGIDSDRSVALSNVDAAIGLRDKIFVVNDTKLVMGIIALNSPVSPAVLSVWP